MPTNNLSFLDFLPRNLRIHSSTIIRQDGKVQSYCGLKITEPVPEYLGIPPLLFPETTSHNIHSIAGASPSNYSCAAIGSRPAGVRHVQIQGISTLPVPGLHTNRTTQMQNPSTTSNAHMRLNTATNNVHQMRGIPLAPLPPTVSDPIHSIAGGSSSNYTRTHIGSRLAGVPHGQIQGISTFPAPGNSTNTTHAMPNPTTSNNAHRRLPRRSPGPLHLRPSRQTTNKTALTSAGVPVTYHSIGPPMHTCPNCHATMWENKVARVPKHTCTIEYSKFRDQIRIYNSMFCFTSFGAKIDHSINKGRAPYTFRINGQNYHRMGTLLPQEGIQPKFAQLYFFDTQNEVRNRTSAFVDKETCDVVDEHIVQRLIRMLDEHSTVAKAFRMARDWCNTNNVVDFKLKLRSDRKTTRQYNAPTVAEIAAIIVDDFGDGHSTRDIIVDMKDTGPKRVSELHPSYMALQYPLLFPYGEDATTQPRDYFIEGGGLLQQYLVDAYTAVEEQQLKWTRNNQDTLRADLYHNLCDAVTRGDTNAEGLGKRIILPRTHVGSPRYMMQNYQDAMALCRAYGNPDLFITFTSNPKWPEIAEMLASFPGQISHDRPEIGTWLFKIKLTYLLEDLTKITSLENQWQTPSDINDIISAELLSPTDDPEGFSVVSKFMLHGPCGKDAAYAACTTEGKCSKHYPRPFLQETSLDEDGYPHYR
ncbi:DNA helicase PIF1, ATP-dependent [Tanacetum coccineum]